MVGRGSGGDAPGWGWMIARRRWHLAGVARGFKLLRVDHSSHTKHHTTSPECQQVVITFFLYEQVV